MADIIRRPFLNHLRADAATYIQQSKNGSVKRAGSGLAFWFRPGTSALSEVPLADREQTLLFRARAVDFQELTVQATVNYRVTDPDLAATRIDFSIGPHNGLWNATPLETLGGLLTELAQQPAMEQLATMTVADALALGITPVRERVMAALRADDRLAERGLAVTDVRVVAISAEPDLERALQTETRERLQQDADRATFERRAVAVERERAIADNELQNQIALARREEELVEQRGQNQRREATEQAAAARITAEATAERERIAAVAGADAIRLRGDADGDAQAARLQAYDQFDRETLLAVALNDLATDPPDITNLTITPDLLTSALAQFATRGQQPELGQTGEQR